MNFQQSPEPFIGVDYWIGKAHLVIDTLWKGRDRNYMYEKELQEVFDTHFLPIIFLKTDLLPIFIDQLLKQTNEYILITAFNDDHCVPYIHYPPQDDDFKKKADLLLNNENLLCWYTKNPCIVHPKIQPVPLGPKWQWKTTRFFGEDKTTHLRIYNDLCITPKQKLLDKNLKQNLLYFNYNQTTNNPLYTPHKNSRHLTKSQLMKNGFVWNPSTPFEDYLHVLQTHKFCASPPGRGCDTHRTWEALMVGTIPIMIHTTLDALFEKLPVVIIDDWSVITEEFLNNEYERIMHNIDYYDFNILYTHYWDKLLS